MCSCQLGNTGRPDGAAHRLISILVAKTYGTPVGALYAGQRMSASTAWARQTAMYLAHVLLGANFTEIGHWFGRDRTTVAHACRVVEERREAAAVDRTLTALETAIRAQQAKTLQEVA